MHSRLQAIYIGLSVLLITSSLYAGTAYTIGDPFASVGNSTVNEFTPVGLLVQTLNDASGSGFTTGSAFDSAGNFYVTNFSTGTVSKFDNMGNLVNSSFVSGLIDPESISFDKAGNFYVGQADAHPGGNFALGSIAEFNSSGTPINTFTVAAESRGTDWIDLQADQQTVLYTSEGTSILSFDTATNTQNAPFATGLPGVAAFALRALGNGDVLVADSSAVLLLDPLGNVLHTYTPGGTTLFALNLDPNGKDFWTADLPSGDIWEINIATAAIDNSFNGCANGTGCTNLAGLSVFGQITQGGGGGTVPEPASIFLMGSGIAGAGLAKWFKQRKLRS